MQGSVSNLVRLVVITLALAHVGMPAVHTRDVGHGEVADLHQQDHHAPHVHVHTHDSLEPPVDASLSCEHVHHHHQCQVLERETLAPGSRRLGHKLKRVLPLERLGFASGFPDDQVLLAAHQWPPKLPPGQASITSLTRIRTVVLLT